MTKGTKYYYIPLMVDAIEEHLKTLESIFEENVKKVKSTDFMLIQTIKEERNYFDRFETFLRNETQGTFALSEYLRRNEYPDFKFAFVHQEISEILQAHDFMTYYEAETTAYVILAISYGFSGDMLYEDYEKILKRQCIHIYVKSEQAVFKEFWRQMLKKIDKMSNRMYKISDRLMEKI